MALVEAHADIRCPWCGLLSTVDAWVEAGARDLCDCGCPRAAHAGYATSDGLPPSGVATQVVTVRSAPCVACGCTRVSGAREIRLT